MSLPLKNGGMAMPQLEYLAKREHAASLLVTTNLGTGKFHERQISCYNLHGIDR